ncbi:MAG: hypothetical protein ACFFCS_04540 [Candidatus Hodarchaeota archaeon]
MTGNDNTTVRKPSIIRRIWNNFAPILMLCIFLDVFLNILVYYNHPVWGFAQYGPGVFVVTVFPLIWFLIYFWCKSIAKKKQQERGSGE